MEKLRVHMSRPGRLSTAACVGLWILAVWVGTGLCCAGGKKPKFAWQKERERRQSCMAVLQVCRTAKVASVNCFFRNVHGRRALELRLRVRLKNITSRTWGFGLDVFLPGKGFQGAGPLPERQVTILAPGEEGTLTFPLYPGKWPESVTLRVRNPWSLRNAPALVLKTCRHLMRKIWRRIRNLSTPEPPSESVHSMRIYCRPWK